MKEQWRLCLCLVASLAFFSSCATAAGSTVSSPATPLATPITVSRTSFSFSGSSQKDYQLQSTATISKLRHGHKEFTINIVDAKRSLIIVFYGYTGPATYTLTNRTNGGDVRITLDTQYWDLSLIPTLSCSLVIESDEPTTTSGIDHMRGKFSCPNLPAGHSNTSRQAVAINDGQFDISIIVES
ncbi:hypothetical protein [Dictyobacter kobayashii]|uniref:hypothetical protein n=1 Tax=Dictyobacter kobayashii TaxID=2014872 RepID=UPI000F81A78C|nr:hypothetical protein [Dictyobacter kobayashii]